MVKDHEQLAEHAELLMQGKLMKQLEKKFKGQKVWALNVFAQTAVRVSEIESAADTQGVYAYATWKHKHQQLIIV